MIAAAIYARVSKKDDEKDAEELKGDSESESVPRQIEGARAFIVKKGRTLDESHVYRTME